MQGYAQDLRKTGFLDMIKLEQPDFPQKYELRKYLGTLDKPMGSLFLGKAGINGKSLFQPAVIPRMPFARNRWP